MRNWKGVLAMGLSAALVISAAQLIPEQNVKSANAETIDNFSDNMTPPSGMPEGTANITNSTITTDAAGGAGVFSYNKGVTYVSDTTITTNKDTSGGIHVAGGGTLYAWDVTATTSGQSSAAIRSDRGGGKMVVDGGTYTSNGVGSPAVYSTADIAVNNAKLTANGSEAVCIEGLNSLRLFDTSLTGNMSDDSQNDCVILHYYVILH